jgi:hypothetical protein
MPLSITQSASKTKTALGCSWKYHANYNLHIPNRSNSGAKVGGIVHIILECLSAEKRRPLVEKILKKGDIFAVQGIKHLTYKWLLKEEIDTPENLQKVKDFALNGLSYDFYGELYGKPIATYTEKDFLIEEPDRYKIRGFLDRLFIYEDGYALIRDYKTSKSVYQGKDLEDPLQANFYAKAVKKMSADGSIPKATKIGAEFLFLKFDCTQESEWSAGEYRGKATKKQVHNNGGRITVTFTDEEIDGFDYELEDYQQYLESFNEETAKENFAADQGMPKDDSFSCALLCGRATYPGQLKKDGALMFGCENKFPTPYYYISQDDKWIASCFLDEREKFLTKYPIKDYSWEERFYKGCPKFSKQ